jgi:hypothetical protein
MSEQKFNIKKVGGNFVAFDTIDKKRSYGRINIKTGKFVGDTRCLIVLNNHWDKEVYEKQEAIYDKALDRIKEDVASGDMTAVDELLKMLPIEAVKGYLAED